MTEEQTSSNSKRLIIVAIVAVLGLIGVSIFLQPKDIAVQKDDDSKQEKVDEKSNSDNEESEKSNDDDKDSYSYTAAAGDSYTVLARQAVAVAGADMTAAERVAAETKLTQDAGEPYLEIGQSVSFEKSTVDAAVDWAKSLSAADKAAWQPYADMVILPSIK